MSDLSGKVAVVTGASRGIGRAVAVLLASRGAQVVAAARGDHAAETVAAIQGAGGRADAAPLDVTDTGSVEAMVGALAENAGDYFVGDRIRSTRLDGGNCRNTWRQYQQSRRAGEDLPAIHRRQSVVRAHRK